MNRISVPLLSLLALLLYMFTAQNPTAAAAATPSAPTTLTAWSTSGLTVNLTWVDRSDNETAFRIERRKWLDGTWEANYASVSANTPRFTDTNVNPGVTYYYRVRAYNPSAGYSAYSNEAVESTALVTADRLPVSKYFGMAVGGDNHFDASLLSIQTCPNGYPRIRFNDDGSLLGNALKWFVVTAVNQDHYIDLGCDDLGWYSDKSHSRHTGEDWNLSLGGASDRGAPVFSIADGIVVFNSGECRADHADHGACDGKAWKGGFGNTLIVAHKLANGDIIFAFYGHLAAPSPFLEGTVVYLGDPIASVGSTGADAYHLHLELRKLSMGFLNSDSKRLGLANSPGFWPSSAYPSDAGKSFIAANYLAASTLIKQNARPTVALNALPASQNVTRGGTTSFAITLDRTNFSGPVTLHASGLPVGITARFDPTDATSDRATLFVSAAQNAPTGQFAITVDAIPAVGVLLKTARVSIGVSGQPIRIDSISAATLNADTWITVTGAGFPNPFTATAQGYAIGAAGMQWISATQVRVLVHMNGSSSYNATLTISGGGQSASGTFQVLAPVVPIRIDNISTATRNADTWITVNGSGFPKPFNAKVQGYAIAAAGLQWTSASQVRILVHMNGSSSYWATLTISGNNQSASGTFLVK